MSNRIMPNQSMYKNLDSFLAQKTIIDIDRNTFLVCNLKDTEHKITISIVFLKDWDSLETDQYNSVIILNKGVVITVPCYWLSIPKELAMPYFESIIEEFYSDEVSTWDIDSNSGNINSSNGINNNCPCRVV